MVIDPRDRTRSEASAPSDDAERDDFEREARKEGRGRRGRKERVLHTRISDDLADDIRKVADDLRVPVSNLVRNVLEEAFSVVESVTDNFGDLIDEVVGEAEAARDRIRTRRRETGASRPPRPSNPPRREEPTPPPAFDDVLGWQPLVLNRERHCDQCDATLARGAQAFAGVTAGGIGGTTLCSDCVSELT